MRKLPQVIVGIALAASILLLLGLILWQPSEPTAERLQKDDARTYSGRGAEISSSLTSGNRPSPQRNDPRTPSARDGEQPATASLILSKGPDLHLTRDPDIGTPRFVRRRGAFLSPPAPDADTASPVAETDPPPRPAPAAEEPEAPESPSDTSAPAGVPEAAADQDPGRTSAAAPAEPAARDSTPETVRMPPPEPDTPPGPEVLETPADAAAPASALEARADTVPQRTGAAVPEAPSAGDVTPERSEEHTSELQSLRRISYAVFCLRSEERRVGKECSEPCRSRWSPYH